MSKLVSWFVTFFDGRTPFIVKCLFYGLIIAAVSAGIAHGQDNRKVPISFLPPPLENATYSLGIYEVKSGKLVRRLHEIAPESAFTVGLNGLITNWDGKDDTGKPVPPGRYGARGYAVGALKVEGTKITGNDWAADDETLRVKQVEAVALIPEDEGLAVVTYNGHRHWDLLRFGGADSRLLWRKPVGVMFADMIDETAFPHGTLEVNGESLHTNFIGEHSANRIADGTAQSTTTPYAAPDPAATKKSAGKDGTTWKIEEGVLTQYSAQNESLRRLVPKADEPVPVSVSASQKTDRIYLLERLGGWQRVRGLSWVETKEENGKPVSTWQTFFERNIHGLDPALETARPPATIEINLVENPLAPSKPQKVKLQAAYDAKGSYLTLSDHLRLRKISERDDLKVVKLVKGKTGDDLTFLQYDGAAWDEFSIEGVKNMMEFDAGEFEMTADGEKTHLAKPAEPPDL